MRGFWEKVIGGGGLMPFPARSWKNFFGNVVENVLNVFVFR